MFAVTSSYYYNPGQKCWEASVTFEIPPLPPINVGFPTKQISDFSLNVEYGGGRGGGGAQEHALSLIVQPIVRIIELVVKWSDACNLPNIF